MNGARFELSVCLFLLLNESIAEVECYSLDDHVCNFPNGDRILASLVCRLTRSRAAADAIPPPEPKPRTMREILIVASIRSREVARAQWSVIRRCEDPLQQLDFSDGLFSIHSVTYD